MNDNVLFLVKNYSYQEATYELWLKIQTHKSIQYTRKTQIGFGSIFYSHSNYTL